MTLLVPIAVGRRAHLSVGLATNTLARWPWAGWLRARPQQQHYVHRDKVRPVAAVGKAQGRWMPPIRSTLQADHCRLNSARGPNMRASCNHAVPHTTINTHMAAVTVLAEAACNVRNITCFDLLNRSLYTSKAFVESRGFAREL